jgi:hypothetical protein
MTQTRLDRGRGLGNREVSHPAVRAKRAHLEEVARGGTWFPHGREAEPTDVEPEAEATAV